MSPPEPYIYHARIVRWVDADTVEVDIDVGFHIEHKNRRCRIFGIDAPEVKRTRGVTEKEKAAGIAMKNEVIKNWPTGTKVLIRTKKLDAFGRWLADLWVPNLVDIDHWDFFSDWIKNNPLMKTF